MKVDSIIANSSINKINSNETFKSYSSNIKSEVNNQNNNKLEESFSSEKVSEKTIKEAIEKANKKLILADRKFEFTVNEETKDIIVKVLDKETDEVIREIPSEKILDMVAKMMELAGLFIDERR